MLVLAELTWQNLASFAAFAFVVAHIVRTIMGDAVDAERVSALELEHDALEARVFTLEGGDRAINERALAKGEPPPFECVDDIEDDPDRNPAPDHPEKEV